MNVVSARGEGENREVARWWTPSDFVALWPRRIQGRRADGNPRRVYCERPRMHARPPRRNMTCARLPKCLVWFVFAGFPGRLIWSRRSQRCLAEPNENHACKNHCDNSCCFAAAFRPSGPARCDRGLGPAHTSMNLRNANVPAAIENAESAEQPHHHANHHDDVEDLRGG